MLFRSDPYDLPTLTCGVSILLVVALAARWIPARRAARVQPMEALRHEEKERLEAKSEQIASFAFLDSSRYRLITP